MKKVNMHEAKSTLSRLVSELRDGIELEIVICSDREPVAKLVPCERPRRTLGVDRGLVTIAADFDAVDRDIAVLFEGH